MRGESKLKAYFTGLASDKVETTNTTGATSQPKVSGKRPLACETLPPME